MKFLQLLYYFVFSAIIATPTMRQRRIVGFIKKALGYSFELFESKYTIKILNTK